MVDGMPGGNDEVVSCRVATMIVRHAHRAGWAPADWLEGVPYSTEHLLQPFGWITYEAAATLCDNAARLAGSVGALRTIGAEAGWDMLAPFHRVLVALGRPALAYVTAPAWMVLFNRASTARAELLDAQSCLLWGSYEITHPLQHLANELVAGSLSSLPMLYGLPRAEVDVIEAPPGSSRQVAFRVRWARGTRRGIGVWPLVRLAARPAVIEGLRGALADVDAMVGKLVGGQSGPRALAPVPARRVDDPPERAELVRSQVDSSSLSAAGLTAREIEVAQHACVGMANKEIAAALGISVPTVKEHVGNIFRKLGVDSRTALVARVLGGS